MIEVVPEKLDLKREVFGQLDELAESDAILASNSSSLPTSRFIDKVKHSEGTVASDELTARLLATARWRQITKASSLNETAKRRVTGSSTASS